MVDIDDLDKQKKGASSSSSGDTSTSTSSSSSSSSDGETFSMGDDEMIDPSEKQVATASKTWASDNGELNTDAHSGEGFKQYMNRQVKEVEELHENIHEMAMNNKDNFDEFTLFMHALFLNFARNRVGIMDTIQDNYGKSRKEAFQLTNKICEQAGEGKLMEKMVKDMTKDLADM